MPLALISARTRSMASARPSEATNRSRSVLTGPPGGAGVRPAPRRAGVRRIYLRTVNPVSLDDTTPCPAPVCASDRGTDGAGGPARGPPVRAPAPAGDDDGRR